MISTSTNVSNINASLRRFSEAAARISDPGQSAGVNDIVQLKQAKADTEISIAVLKKVQETQRAVDVIA